MKKKLIAISLAGFFGVPAFAQSSVTLYGIIDAGLTYTNNSGGHAQWQMQSGVMQGSRWGLKGSEDLGDGTKAIFQLENGFNVMNGKLGQGGLDFGRQAYVGVTNEGWGTLTFGRQYDPIVDIVQSTTMNGNWGAFFSHPSDIDNTDNGFRVNNAIKYVSPLFGGVQAEVMYAFGGVAGSFRSKSTIAAGVNYTGGPLYLGAAYFYAKDPAQQFTDGNFVTSAATPGVSNGSGAFGYVGTPNSMQTIGVGGAYTFGPALIGLSYTNVQYKNATQITGNIVTFNNAELWGQYAVTAATTLGLGYNYTWGKVNFNSAKPKYGQVNAVADYRLSKRTDVYAMAVYQHASGGANADIYDGFVGAQSATQNQVAARIGIRHKF
ncbi:porin [Burkholderia diffusa]|uniref:porin n=1 Tax=Burkholderia diffusa TaxID=488732 RepID=UPI000757384C|nr:porin [Burkholderia diffusa]KVN06964.1 porin [Burkholderia diffusa]